MDTLRPLGGLYDSEIDAEYDRDSFATLSKIAYSYRVAAMICAGLIKELLCVP